MRKKEKKLVAATIYIACFLGIVITIGIIWALNNYKDVQKVYPNNIPKLIELADSIRNSKPDSALSCYNQIISEFKNSKEKQNNSHTLALAHVGIANVYSDKGDYQLALKNDSIAFDLASKSGDQLAKAKALTVKGITLSRLGEYENAMYSYQTALELALELKDAELQAKIVANRAVIYSYQGSYQKTIDGFKKALEIGKQIKNESLVAGNYLNLAIVYNCLSKNDSVLAYTKLALDSFKEINDKNGELLCYQNLGTIYYNFCDYGKAIEHYQLSIKLALEMDDKSNTAKGYNNLADIYIHLGDNSAAINYLFQSIKIKEQLNDKLNLGKAYIGVGNLYYARNDYAKALAYFKKSLTLCLELKCLDEIGNNYYSIANIYSAENKSDSAIANYNKALELYRQTGNTAGISNLYIGLGDEYRLRKQFDRSENLLLQALQSKKELEDEESFAVVKNHLANLYLDQSEENNQIEWLQKAEKAGTESYKIANSLGVLPIMQDACRTLMKVYKKLKMYPEALDFSEKFNSLSDSILNKDKVQALTFAEARWNVEKKQQEIDNLENTQKLNQQIIKQKEIETRQQKIITWFVVILFCLTLSFISIVALYIRKRRDAIHQKQLESIAILRLQNTRNTISPHFVFNVLNNIWAIIDDKENARSQFGNLTNLIRQSLIHTDQITISLEEEIEFVKSFTELQKFRLNNELEIKWDIAPNVNFKSHVPGMILQIPVENAIKHALAPKPENRELQISIYCDLDFLILMVADNGEGFHNSSSPFKGTGTGLKVLTKTIHILNEKNEKKMSYEILDRNNEGITGTKVVIKIPLQYHYNLPGITN